jgi:outer membrane protein TolC
MIQPRARFRTAVLIWLYIASADAQPPSHPLTLDDCIHLAEAAQSSVTIARQQAEIAQYGITAARAGFLPQAALNTGYTYNSPLPRNREEVSFVALNGIREYAGAGVVNLEVDTWGRLRAQMARARAGADLGSANILLSRREL